LEKKIRKVILEKKNKKKGKVGKKIKKIQKKEEERITVDYCCNLQ